MSEIRASKAEMVLLRLLILSPEDAELVIAMLGLPGMEVLMLDCELREALQRGSMAVSLGVNSIHQHNCLLLRAF